MNIAANMTMTLTDKVAAYVCRTPGCNLERISVAMGYGCRHSKDYRQRYPEPVRTAVLTLINQGQIERYRHPFADDKSPDQFYVRGTAPANNVYRDSAPIKVKIDPTLIDKTTPKSAAAKAIQERLKQFKAAVDEMEQRGEIETCTEITKKVCSNETWGRNNPHARDYYKAAVARIQARNNEAPETWEPPLQHRVQRLEQQLMMRTARIDELQKALAECQTLTPRQWLAEQHEFWGQRALANDEDSPAAARNAEAFRLLLDLYEVPQAEEA